MASSFIAMVYATLEKSGVNIAGMSATDAIAKFNEINGKDNLKKEEIQNNNSSKQINKSENKDTKGAEDKKPATKIKLGQINTDIYEKVTGKKLVNKDIVMPNTNITHTENRHQAVFEKYKEKLPQIINEPDYIFQGNKDRLLTVKNVGRNVEVVLELSFENKNFSNKVVSMWEIKDKDLENLKKKKKILYKK